MKKIKKVHIRPEKIKKGGKKNVTIPVPCGPVGNNKLFPLHEELLQEVQHRHARVPCIMHQLEKPLQKDQTIIMFHLYK